MLTICASSVLMPLFVLTIQEVMINLNHLSVRAVELLGLLKDTGSGVASSINKKKILGIRFL